jgi:phosphate transport system substrate-binding protein
MKKILIGLMIGMLISGGIVHAADNELLGAGATFPQPLYTKMFDEYNKQFNVMVNYQGIGSGGGVKQLMSKTVDFGATDAFLTAKEMSEAPAKVFHVPICLGAVVVAYNVPGVESGVKFTPDLLADIFLGNIKKWNDEKLQAINSGIKLPELPITVVYRSDGSGTTAIFTDYLKKVSNAWASKVGQGKSVKFPVGVGAKGNPGVAGLVQQTPGAIGYTELTYALQNKMSFGAVKGASGTFIKPTQETVSLAANVDIPADTRVSITNSSVPGAYPIAGFTWVILYKEQNYGGRSQGKAQNVVKLIWWMIHDAQVLAPKLDYAPLPASVVKKAEAILKTVVYGGKVLI